MLLYNPLIVNPFAVRHGADWRDGQRGRRTRPTARAHVSSARAPPTRDSCPQLRNERSH